jgi:uncharacterized membrane protein YkvA (DUF1232 family)
MIGFIKRHWLLLISLIYLIWPLDLIAEIFGPLGLIDDGLVLFIALLAEIFNLRSSEKQKPKKR